MFYQSSESNERRRIETLQSDVERVGRVPAEISDQLPIVEIALEHDQARFGQAGVQIRVDCFHLTRRN